MASGGSGHSGMPAAVRMPRAGDGQPIDFDAQRAVERDRFAENARRARVMLITFPPLGAVLAAIIQYLALIEIYAEADWRYQLERPDMDIYLRLVPPSIVGGFLAAGIVTRAFTALAEALPSIWRMATIGLFYGMLMPMLVGLLVPLNLFILSVTGLSRVTNQGDIDSQVADLIFSIPRSVYTGWLLDTGWGVVAGFVMAALAFGIFHIAGPLTNPARGKVIAVAAVAVAATTLFLVIAGPFPILEFLFDLYSDE